MMQGWAHVQTRDLRRARPSWQVDLTARRKFDQYQADRDLDFKCYHYPGAAADYDTSIKDGTVHLDKSHVYVPRQWALSHDAVVTACDYMPDSCGVEMPMIAKHCAGVTDVDERSRILFAGTLCASDPPQVAAATSAIKMFESPKTRGGVLCLPCGFGKTVLALYLMQRLGRRTVVLVHKEPLADQWIERASKFLPHARVGRVQRAVCEYEDCDVVVCVMQSLIMSKREYPRALFDTCGLVVVDECHRVGSDTFSLALPMFPARYRLGLSATPERRDGLTPILNWHIGVIEFRCARVRENVLVDRVVYSRPGRKEIKYKNRTAAGGQPQLGVSRMITNLTLDKERNYEIVKLIWERCHDGRQVLALSDRVDHVHAVARLITEAWRRSNETTASPQEQPVIDYEPRVASVYIGGMKAAERAVATRAQVIVATYGMAYEFLDIPRVDTVVFMTPRSEIEQPCGRCLRPHPHKNVPLIVDFVDTFSIFEQFGWKHHRYFQSVGYTTRVIRVGRDAASGAGRDAAAGAGLAACSTTSSPVVRVANDDGGGGGGGGGVCAPSAKRTRVEPTEAAAAAAAAASSSALQQRIDAMFASAVAPN